MARLKDLTLKNERYTSSRDLHGGRHPPYKRNPTLHAHLCHGLLANQHCLNFWWALPPKLAECWGAPPPPDPGKSASGLQGTGVTWYRGSMVPWYHGTMVPWHTRALEARGRLLGGLGGVVLHHSGGRGGR